MDTTYCMGCMHPLEDGHKCKYCQFDIEKYTPDGHVMPAGTIIGNGQYLIGRALGQGGFGITYIGMDLNLLKQVAIKEFFPKGMVVRDCTKSLDLLIYEKLSEEDFEKGVSAFLREGRILASLKSNDGIVSIHNFFRENNTAYLVMDYVEGQTLKSYINALGPMTLDDTLGLMKPTLTSLYSLHQKSIIHRDISADNLIISDINHLTLIDFGAARIINPNSTVTSTILCKNGFSAIEQYNSDGFLGPWTDIYSLCACIYFMLTGTVPQNSTSRYISDELKPLSDFENLASNEESLPILSAIMKGLELDPSNRFTNMKELFYALYNEEMPVTEEVKGLNTAFNPYESKISTSTTDSPSFSISKTYIRRGLKKERKKIQQEKNKKRNIKILISAIIIAILGINLYFFADNTGISEGFSNLLTSKNNDGSSLSSSEDENADGSSLSSSEDSASDESNLSSSEDSNADSNSDENSSSEEVNNPEIKMVSVTNLSKEKALKKLKKSGCLEVNGKEIKVKFITKESGKYSKKIVINQSPKKNKTLSESSKIILTISIPVKDNSSTTTDTNSNSSASNSSNSSNSSSNNSNSNSSSDSNNNSNSTNNSGNSSSGSNDNANDNDVAGNLDSIL